MTATLRTEGISKSFGGVQALDNCSLTAPAGKISALIGPNGSGKTTLFNVMTGYEKADSGQVFLGDGRITGAPPPRVYALGVGRTFQIPKPYRQLSVIENVMISTFLRERSTVGARELADVTLSDLGLAPYRDRPASELTVGLLKRLEVARALAMQPKLVLFDEIMAGLTPTEVGAMTEIVAGLPARGITVVWVEHVLYAIMKTATRMVVINRGCVIAEGAPATVARDPAVVKAYLGEEMQLA